MNGARIGRRGKLQGGRQGSAGQAAACPSDPFGTGLMIAGGTPTVIRWRGGSVDGNRKAASPAVAAPRRATRAGPGRAASPLAANPSASRAAIARLHPPSRARKRPTRRRRVVRSPALGAGRRAGGAATGKPAGARGSRGGAKAAGRSRRQQGRRVARRGQGRGRSGWQERGQGGNKSRSSRGSAPRGDDWQPRGASAHESRLGVLGGGRGRQGR